MATPQSSTSCSSSSSSSIGERYNFSWQQTMLRIKDPKVSLPFYEKHFGMKLVHFYHFNDAKFSLYFLERPRDGVQLPTPGTKEAEQYLWTMKGVCLELTHNHGSEEDNSFKINNGNEEPYRGFGHIAFNCQDVVQISEELEKEGVKFHKRPHEGRMKTIAFAKDPDGYFIELCNRNNTNNNNNNSNNNNNNNNKEGGGGVKEEIKEKFNLSQTMIRVKDPNKSINFYNKLLGMQLIYKKIYSDFTVYFLTCLPKGLQYPQDIQSEEAREFMKNLWYPCLELTHNHGTEKEESFIYHNGNDQPQGFGHIGFLTDNLDKSCDELIQQGVTFRKKPQDGKMRGIAFALDPDGYSVEIIQRGVTF